ncbi:hypothetical protein CAEBREN_11428 [Caenorhabditis brenneri]|uniref:Uncharacterized protein n=1 Tax=Caenorhabditis brenneri TaxID=135651 RepID=G0MGB9_CAEBE|nr:hypothetical protein CAEBREN_11428 [Caenorhabditis brenneri]
MTTSSTQQWSSEDDEDVDYKEDHSLLLIIMFGTHFCFFLFTYFWLYPTDEPPKNAVMHRLATDIKISQRTGEPIRPSTRLFPHEISQLTRRSQCPERRYNLSEEDQKTLNLVQDGEINYLRSPTDLLNDLTMKYGSLIVQRGVPEVEVAEKNIKKENKEQENFDEDAAVEDLQRLKRQKEPEKLKKKKKTKERMDALDQLTRGQSAEKLTLFSRIIPDRHAQSRKVQKTVSSTMNRNPERTLEVQATMEDDKTQQRVIKKPSTMRPHQRPSMMDVNVKKKKSLTQKDGKTRREDPSLARTMEETKGSGSSRDPSIVAPLP